MKPARPILAAGAALAAMLLVAAATTSERPLRVGVLDPGLLRQQSATLRAQMEEMAAPARAILSDLQVKQAALSKALEDFARKRTALSEEASRKQAGALQAQAREVEGLSRRLKESMDKAESEDLGPLRQRVGATLAGLARERGLSLVLTSASVLYHAGDLDLTAAVAARLDSGLIK